MSPVTRLDGQDKLCFLFICGISTRSIKMKFKKQNNRIVESKLVPFATVLALWTLITLVIKV